MSFPARPFRKHSQLQKDVLSLYRNFLRAIREKPAEVQPQFRTAVREAFDRNREAVSTRDIVHIEHYLRQGKRQLKYFKSPSVLSVGTMSARPAAPPTAPPPMPTKPTS